MSLTRKLDGLIDEGLDVVRDNLPLMIITIILFSPLVLAACFLILVGLIHRKFFPNPWMRYD